MDVEYYVDQDDEVAMELKEKKICRFCLSQTAKLTSMFDSPNRGTTPLGIQAMACASLEVTIIRVLWFICIDLLQQGFIPSLGLFQ